MISDLEVQETFYNAMLETMFTGNTAGSNPQYVKHNLTEPNLRPVFIKGVVTETFRKVLNSAQLNTFEDGSLTLQIPSVRGNLITPKNVSNMYSQLFSALVIQYQSGSEEMLNGIISSTINLPSFKKMIEDVIKFYLSGMQEQQPKQTKPATIEGIRETFYNIMVDQYLNNGMIPKEDLEACESYIFTALSAYVVYTVAIFQKDVNGVRLCDGAIVTLQNCPPQIKPIFIILLDVKKITQHMNFTQAEEQHILNTLSSKQESEIEQTEHVRNVIGKITSIAIQISQIPHFKQVIGDVINFLMIVS
jgi:hypothetical protein